MLCFDSAAYSNGPSKQSRVFGLTTPELQQHAVECPEGAHISGVSGYTESQLLSISITCNDGSPPRTVGTVPNSSTGASGLLFNYTCNSGYGAARLSDAGFLGLISSLSFRCSDEGQWTYPNLAWVDVVNLSPEVFDCSEDGMVLAAMQVSMGPSAYTYGSMGITRMSFICRMAAAGAMQRHASAHEQGKVHTCKHGALLHVGQQQQQQQHHASCMAIVAICS